MTQRIDLRSAHSSEHHGTMAKVRQTSLILAVIAYCYLCTLFIKPGPITYFLTVPPLIVIIITAFSRGNDLSCDMSSPMWTVRRVGFVFIFWFAAGQLLGPLARLSPWPSWLIVFACWGVALAWLTTPHQPPWSHYVWRDHPAAIPHPQRRRSDDFDSSP